MIEHSTFLFKDSKNLTGSLVLELAKLPPFMVWTALSTVILFSSIILCFDIIYKGSAFSL